MSKIGRKPIQTSNVEVTMQGQEVRYKGPKGSGVHVLPVELKAEAAQGAIVVSMVKESPESKKLWGLHRALLANEINGVQQGFEKKVEINGLGFKAALAGQKIIFTLGYSHKIEMNLPTDVTLEVDKTGQKLVFKSKDKIMLGQLCGQIRALRPPEPYKGTGILVAGEVIARKAGKTKAAA